MINLEVTTTIAIILVFIPQITVYIWHIFLLLWSSRRKYTTVECTCHNYENRVISFILPVKREPFDYIVNAAKYIHSLFLGNYEIIIVSDDPPDFKDKLMHIVQELREQGINAWLLWRSTPRGFRTGALNDGLNASIGDYVYVIDVDTRPEKSLIERAICNLESDQRIVGVVGRWEPLNQDTRVSQALGLGLRFLARVLYKARSICGFFTFPLGTGTVYRASTLKNTLHGWDERRIQDDMEIGARILGEGLYVQYLDDSAVYVENPGTYRSFRIQQSRWAYGALDTAISRFKEIIGSPVSIVVRLEALNYLLQYIPQALVFIGCLILGFVSMAGINEPNYALYMFVFWLLTMYLYGLFMYKTAYQGKSIWGFMVLSGRLTALSTAIAPYVAFSTLKAIIRMKEVYKRTPKGIYQKTTRGFRTPWELIFGLFFFASSINSAINGMVVISTWLLMNSICYFYVVYRFPREVFYD